MTKRMEEKDQGNKATQTEDESPKGCRPRGGSGGNPSDPPKHGYLADVDGAPVQLAKGDAGAVDLLLEKGGLSPLFQVTFNVNLPA